MERYRIEDHHPLLESPQTKQIQRTVLEATRLMNLLVEMRQVQTQDLGNGEHTQVPLQMLLEGLALILMI